MTQEFADALEEAGYDVKDVSDRHVTLILQDIRIHGEQFDKVDLTVFPDPALSDGLAIGVVDVWRANNELTDAHEAVLEEVGTPGAGGAVYVLDAEELDNFDKLATSIREVRRPT